MVSLGLGIKEDYKKTPLWVRILHNIRKHGTKNSIFSTKNNFHFLSEDFEDIEHNLEDMKQFFNEEEEFLKEVVKSKTKQISKNKNHILESLISISNDKEIEGMTETELKEFLIQKMETFTNELKNEFGLKIYQYSIHLDEGHIENGKEVKNIHIHFIHSNINLENGKSFSKQLFLKSKKGLSYRQDMISTSFEMKRGLEGSLNKHKHYSVIKEEKQQEQELKDKIRVLEEENLKLQQINQEQEKTIENLENEVLKLKEEIENSYKNNRNEITETNFSNDIKKLLHKENKKLKDKLKILKDRKQKGSFGFTMEIYNELVNIHNKIEELLNDNGDIQRKINNILNNDLLSEEDKKFYIDKLLNNDSESSSPSYQILNLE